MSWITAPLQVVALQWENLSAYFRYPANIRQVIYTQMLSNRYTASSGNWTKPKGFPEWKQSVEATLSGTDEHTGKWTMPIQSGNLTLSQLAIYVKGDWILWWYCRIFNVTQNSNALLNAQSMLYWNPLPETALQPANLFQSQHFILVHAQLCTIRSSVQPSRDRSLTISDIELSGVSPWPGYVEWSQQYVRPSLSFLINTSNWQPSLQTFSLSASLLNNCRWKPSTTR